MERLIGLLVAIEILLSAWSACADAVPERINFRSADDRTMLTGYLFMPRDQSGRRPAVVMMHGRAGVYSTNATGRYDATTLSRRHLEWGELWAARGYIALLVDGFGPRGYAQGFPRFSYETRPAELDEVTVRPLDAYGALAYLRTRPDVAPQPGRAAGLVQRRQRNTGCDGHPRPWPHGRRISRCVGLYPACGLKGQFVDRYLPYAPVQVYHGTTDEEVSPRRCGELVERSRADDGDIEIQFYPGASHGFDDPSSKRLSNEANAVARDDAVQQSLRFFADQLANRADPAGNRDPDGRWGIVCPTFARQPSVTCTTSRRTSTGL
jgi:dienelactone hydrolase